MQQEISSNNVKLPQTMTQEKLHDFVSWLNSQVEHLTSTINDAHEKQNPGREAQCEGMRDAFMRCLKNCWLAKGYNRAYIKELIIGSRAYPFIAENDEEEIDEYIKYQYCFEDFKNGFARTECQGLAVAHIYNTLSISLSGHASWEKNFLLIKKGGSRYISRFPPGKKPTC